MSRLRFRALLIFGPGFDSKPMYPQLEINYFVSRLHLTSLPWPLSIDLANISEKALMLDMTILLHCTIIYDQIYGTGSSHNICLYEQLSAKTDNIYFDIKSCNSDVPARYTNYTS